MTLIVANIYDGDRVSIVSDTEVTWDPGTTTAPPGTIAKIVILRRGLAIGISGPYPEQRIRDVISVRGQPLAEIVEMLEQDTHAGFVIASLEPAQLITVVGGEVNDRTSIGQAWTGDRAAYSTYQSKFLTEWVGKKEMDVPFRQMSAMSFQTSFALHDTVGGHTVRVDSDVSGFLFVPDSRVVVGGTIHTTIYFAGSGATPGAFGLFDANRGFGRLFLHEAPDTPVEVLVSSPESFRREALERYKQELLHARPLFSRV
ncbi:hypothetical protein [Microbacterium aurugineum]|uniref:DUF4429 domain-containing protein n=1 Tax=Microbacterium aurugineum TaxID=2851642 RepID=A0ABY4IXL1_9MICO|nr:hypothetical protein [Microbacterium aurugineum]UPL17494.1 hypothetical protein KV397_06880 [Microbacterium aurugineum]